MAVVKMVVMAVDTPALELVKMLVWVASILVREHVRIVVLALVTVQVNKIHYRQVPKLLAYNLKLNA